MKKIKNFINFYFKQNSQSILIPSFILLFLLLEYFLQVTIPLIQKKLIDNILELNYELKYVLLMLIMGLCLLFIRWMITFVIQKLNIKVKKNIENKLMKKAIREDSKLLREKGAGGYMVSIFGNSEQLAYILTRDIFALPIMIIVVVIVIMISFEWTIYFSILVVFTYLIILSIISRSNRYYRNTFSKAREVIINLNPSVLEFLENRQTLVSFSNLSDEEKNLFDKFDERDKLLFKAFKGTATTESITASIIQVSLIVFFSISIFEISKGNLSISEFITLLTYFGFVFKPIPAIQEFSQNLNKFEVIYSRIKDDFYFGNEHNIPKDDSMKFNNVFFQHVNYQKDISVDILNSVGVIGISGEGKSSLTKSIIGENEINSGKILIGNRHNDQYSKYELHSFIRYLPQDSQIFNKTLRENIEMGRKGLDEKTFQLKLNDLVKKFTSGYLTEEEIRIYFETENYFDVFELIDKDTDLQYIAECVFAKKYFVNEKYEKLIKQLKLDKIDPTRNLGFKGADVSGGERKRIALARFLLSESKAPYIMDEPFASLDSITIEEIVEVLKKQLANQKGLIISHKMKALSKLVDNVLVLDNGEYEYGEYLLLSVKNKLLSNLIQKEKSF